jgi:hypothetical protein
MRQASAVWAESGQAFKDTGGTRWLPKVCVSPALRGFIHVRDDIGGVRQFVAVAGQYDDALAIGVEYARTLRPRGYEDTIRMKGGAKKSGSWWLTFDVEGLD